MKMMAKWGTIMSKLRLTMTLMSAVGLVLLVLAAEERAYAQLMIDMSRVTCADYLAMPPDQSRMFSAWMSGYYNQKGGFSWIDLGAYARNVANVKQWCATYPTELVMNGLQRATGKQ
jgi:HdeA/HdeB family